MKVGIDHIHFYTSDYYIDLEDYAREKGEDLAKFHDGIGQDQMAVIPPDEDIITLAANAAEPLFDEVDRSQITTLLFATESSIDQSKAAGTYVHRLLGLNANCRVVELKQACYAATAAVQMAAGLVRQNPYEKILVVAADIARYDMNTPGEATQGCGAAAMIISQNPRLVVLEPGSGTYTEDVMDFWRPNYRQNALVDGKYSAKIYIKALRAAWLHFQKNTQRMFEDIEYFLYHLPFSKMANKAHKQLMKLNAKNEDDVLLDQHIGLGQQYNRLVGNSYTASLYIALISLLDHAKEDLAQKRIAFFSYGSGCVAELYTGLVENNYHQMLKTKERLKRLNNRIRLTYQEYVDFYSYQLPTDGSEAITPHKTRGRFRLSGIKNHQRQYEVVEPRE